MTPEEARDFINQTAERLANAPAEEWAAGMVAALYCTLDMPALNSAMPANENRATAEQLVAFYAAMPPIDPSKVQ